jgi:hypothetical protein
MPRKERAILLKMNEQLKQLTQPVATTFSPQSGVVAGPTVYQPTTTPLPSGLLGDLEGSNFTTGQD